MTEKPNSMRETPPLPNPPERLGLDDLPCLCRPLTVLGALALSGGLVMNTFFGPEGHFVHAYLYNYGFFLSITLGGLFFVAIQHVTRAGWSVTVRRLAEVFGANVPVMAILFLPIVAAVFNAMPLYPWSQPEIVAEQPLLQHKAVYLNPTFFTLRAVFYFAVWGWLGRYFLRRSLEQDQSKDPGLTRRMERLSPAALVLLGGTVTFASFDWLMSLEPEWFSTIFGLYYFAGAMVGFLAVVILAAMLLQATGRATVSITVEHYHDLGKLLFGFVIFWGYMAFSQYMLIWYANIPEETQWYLTRQTGSWAGVSLVLLFGHLLIPFFGLLPRAAKRRKAILGFWAVWLLATHWLDLYWLVMPSMAGVEGGCLPLGLVDVLCFVGIGSLYLAGAIRLATAGALVPQGDPRLAESLAFENM